MYNYKLQPLEFNGDDKLTAYEYDRSREIDGGWTKDKGQRLDLERTNGLEGIRV